MLRHLAQVGTQLPASPYFCFSGLITNQITYSAVCIFLSVLHYIAQMFQLSIDRSVNEQSTVENGSNGSRKASGLDRQVLVSLLGIPSRRPVCAQLALLWHLHASFTLPGVIACRFQINMNLMLLMRKCRSFAVTILVVVQEAEGRSISRLIF